MSKYTKIISILNNRKNEIFKNINTEMQMRAARKISMTSEQITYYREFLVYYEKITKNVKINLREINRLKGLSNVQVELLCENTNYENVAGELRILIVIQVDTIEMLTHLNDYANKTLGRIRHEIAN